MGQQIIVQTRRGLVGTTIENLGDGTRSKKRLPKKIVHDCSTHLTWQGSDSKTGEHLYSCRICGQLHIKNQ
jgi:hypothetical protein